MERTPRVDRLSVRFAPDLLAALSVLALQDGMALSEWVRAELTRIVRERAPDFQVEEDE